MFITSTEITTCYISKTETIVEDQEELLEQENASSIQNTTLNNDKAIPNILEGLLTKNIEPQQPIDLQFRKSFGRNSNSQLKSNTNQNKKERMEGVCLEKFMIERVINKKWNTSFRDEGLNLIPKNLIIKSKMILKA